MFDFSTSFKRVKQNQYAFLPGYRYTSKAYIVTYKEKQILQQLLRDFSGKLMITCGVLYLPIRFASKIGILVVLIWLSINYLRYKKKVRQTIGDRKKQFIEPYKFSDYIEYEANKLTWQELYKHCLVGLVMMAIFLWMLFFDMKVAGWGYLFVGFGILISFIALVSLILKIVAKYKIMKREMNSKNEIPM